MSGYKSSYAAPNPSLEVIPALKGRGKESFAIELDQKDKKAMYDKTE